MFFKIITGVFGMVKLADGDDDEYNNNVDNEGNDNNNCGSGRSFSGNSGKIFPLLLSLVVMWLPYPLLCNLVLLLTCFYCFPYQL